MSLHLGIRRPRKHRAADVIANLRAQVTAAGDRIGYLERTLADVRAKRAEAEMVVVCQGAEIDDLKDERDQAQAELAALRAQLAPYLAADATAGAITVPQMERDTSAIEDQATAPIQVTTLREQFGG
jgi:predicted  nucleic acid-binding Zn-ribbon protein